MAKELAGTLRALMLGDTDDILRGRSKSVEVDKLVLARDRESSEFETKNPFYKSKSSKLNDDDYSSTHTYMTKLRTD